MRNVSVRSWALWAGTLGLLLFTAIAAAAEEPSGRWRLAGFTKYRDGLFADMSRLAGPAPGTPTVWVRIAPSARSTYLQSINDYLRSINMQNRGFKFIEIQCEFRCADHRLRFLKFAYLDRSERIFHATDDPRPAWYYIPPGNLWGSVEKLACERQ